MVTTILTRPPPPRPVLTLWASWKNHHGIVMTLAFVALIANVFSSLAGSYFQIVSVNETISVPVSLSGQIGSNYNNLPLGYYLPYSGAAGVSRFVFTH
jgi:hypothetical protein